VCTVACVDCGSLQDLPDLPRRATARCFLCARQLERTSGRSVTAALACSAGAFLLLIPANVLPLMHVSMLEMTRTSRIASGVVELWNHQWVIVAALVCVYAILLPPLRFACLALTLGLLEWGRRPRWVGPLFRWSLWLDPWAMPEVFLIGGAIGYSRIAAILPVTVDLGGVCLILAAVLCMLTRAALEPRIVWEAITPQPPLPSDGKAWVNCAACGLVQPVSMQRQRCPRCGLRIAARKPDSMRRTLAFVIAGVALYLPANFLPMSTDLQLGQRVDHRIVDGIADLFKAGLWPLGIVIFCTSITIPLLKLAGLGWFMLSVRRRDKQHLRRKTRLYRLIDEIGRWSNVDVFTIAAFTPLLQFNAFATAGAADGATAFILVVTITMVASRAFDPRMMWDA
jgi:paraquat-inducible protein A